jgi:acetaldehyde dehydrogenase (acetylating)
MASPDIDIILATGGLSMVKAAHSYGKPAIGVGPGNTPAYVDRSADLEKAARDIVSSKTFDNGVICSSEQAVIVHRDVEPRFRKILEELGVYFLSSEEILKVSDILVKGSAMDPDMVGKSVEFIAEAAHISVPLNTRLLIAPLEGVGAAYPLSREILSPLLAYYVEDNWEEACKRCIEILKFGGIGHTLAVHATGEEVITEFSHKKPVFRILINTPTSHGAVGITTSLTPSMTLSTGTWGGGISTDNISAYHLINIKRVAYETSPVNGPHKEDHRLEDMTREDIELIVRKALENIDLKNI